VDWINTACEIEVAKRSMNIANRFRSSPPAHAASAHASSSHKAAQILGPLLAC
jgi:hypothetical protein